MLTRPTFARLLSSTPARMRGEFIDQYERQGLSRLAYLEVVGVVARTSAVDACLFGLGAEQVELPAVTTAGEPSGEYDERATIGTAWVPTVGNVSAGGALGALPSENDAVDDLHDAFYVPRAEMKNLAYQAELSRAQMELLAARASYLNGCHY